MRIHTDVLTSVQIGDAFAHECSSGRIARTVYFKTLEPHNSRSHARAFEIQLSSYDKADGDGRRAGNSGSYGAGEEYAATYDEWGWLLAALYELDPDMVCGTVKYPVYAGRGDYHYRTGMSYAPLELIESLERGYDPYPYVTGRSSGSVGRIGAGRTTGKLSKQLAAAREWYEAGNRTMKSGLWFKYAPRTVEEVRKFAHLS